MTPRPSTSFAIVGDVHGHLQLALCTLARWQRERGRKFSAVFLVGDVGTFTEDSQLDNATRKHARDNLCELEFLTQWFWFHGHSTPIITPTQVDSTMVVPLGDVAFSHGKPGLDGWAILDYDDDKPKLAVGAPAFLKAMHQRQWLQTPGGRLVHPDLAPYME